MKCGSSRSENVKTTIMAKRKKGIINPLVDRLFSEMDEYLRAELYKRISKQTDFEIMAFDHYKLSIGHVEICNN